MLCDSCGKSEASVHYTEIISEKITKINLCGKCATKKGIDINEQFSIGNVLSGLIQDKEITMPGVSLRCKNCGLLLSHFKKIGRLGCADCYRTFSDILRVLLQSIHKRIKHVGKMIEIKHKKTVISREEKMAILQNKLQSAIENEAYEEAAALRDEISGLKKKEHKKEHKKDLKKSK
ncbi:UvrB/UvrC motif-containing protein [Chlamydiota bacterium]